MAALYFLDLGPRFGWTMVFLSEYVGPLLIYLLFYFQLPYIYTYTHTLTPPCPHPVVSLVCVCHSLHYIKRLMETVFVHRFTHGTLPLGVIMKVGVWVSFSIMTQCVPVAVFTLMGFVQMTIWAKWKHKTYTREFKDYPPVRMSILPFIL
ncbi:Very-long-chain enoyl-CoA reductase [Bagarius yarrelli]|uniref:Very-long-chain enoyl-CoA reductase n=1 Tax=Bagarius yarrelli TaxID=175774 RepID=A0A556V4S6_BAGYA|nr:Very-long-chain enoyl-CoA reductase [Bagarius yarrelli]